MDTLLSYIAISGDCQNTGTRCGPLCTTSMVALRMARHRPVDFSDGRFQISLKRFYPISKSCLGRDNAKTRCKYSANPLPPSEKKALARKSCSKVAHGKHPTTGDVDLRTCPGARG